MSPLVGSDISCVVYSDDTMSDVPQKMDFWFCANAKHRASGIGASGMESTHRHNAQTSSIEEFFHLCNIIDVIPVIGSFRQRSSQRREI